METEQVVEPRWQRRGQVMKILFIGGTGTISQAVSQLAVDRGIELVLLNRGRTMDRAVPGARIIQADIRGDEADRALFGEKFDAVVDWVCFTAEHAADDVRRFSGKTRQFIFISSASVYQKPPAQAVVTESTPLANPFWNYARDKIACELLFMQAYREQGFPVTIVRPSHTYGTRSVPAGLNSSRHPWSLVDRMRRGESVVVHGDGSSLWTMTYNTDFAAGFLGLVGSPVALGHAVHITSDELLTWDQIYRTIGEAAGVTPNLVHIASDFIARALPTQAGSLLGDKSVSVIFDNQKIKRMVPGFTAVVPFAEGMRRSMAWFSKHPDQQTVDAEWNREIDTLLRRYREIGNG